MPENYTQMNFKGEFDDFPTDAVANDVVIVNSNYYAYKGDSGVWVELNFRGNFNEDSMPTTGMNSNDLICVYTADVVTELMQ